MPGPGGVNVVDVISLVAFVILSLTVATVSKAISLDTIGVPMIQWAERKYGQTSKIYKLIDCYWCNSMWVSVLVCTAALPLAAMAYSKPWWWGAAAMPFVAPAVRYAASVIIDKTKVD